MLAIAVLLSVVIALGYGLQAIWILTNSDAPVAAFIAVFFQTLVAAFMQTGVWVLYAHTA
jgi:hypothetical protein